VIEFAVKAPTIPIPFEKLLKVVAMVDGHDAGTRRLLEYFMAFQESFNRFPGFNYEIQDVFQERVDGRIKFYTYVVRQ
jgi:arginine/lysine/ornithine decarboxylase